MRIGLLHTWLHTRYTPFWKLFLNELGMTVVETSNESSLDLPMCQPIQHVLNQVFALKNNQVDYIVIPDIQKGIESARGSAGCFWLLDLEASLQQHVPGLPPVLKVPESSDPRTPGVAAEIGQALTQNPMLAKRALEKAKHLLKPETRFAAPLSPFPLVGVVAQPYILENVSVQNLLHSSFMQVELGSYTIDLSPERLRQEGLNSSVALELPTDLELAGMSRYFNRLGKISGIIYLVAEHCEPIPRLARKLAAEVHKPHLTLVWGQDWLPQLHEFKKALLKTS